MACMLVLLFSNIKLYYAISIFVTFYILFFLLDYCSFLKIYFKLKNNKLFITKFIITIT